MPVATPWSHCGFVTDLPERAAHPRAPLHDQGLPLRHHRCQGGPSLLGGVCVEGPWPCVPGEAHGVALLAGGFIALSHRSAAM